MIGNRKGLLYALLAAGALGAAGVTTWFATREKANDVIERRAEPEPRKNTIEVGDTKLLDKAIIRVQGTPEERENAKAAIRKALTIALGDVELEQAYRNARVVEQIVVKNRIDSLRHIANRHPERFRNILDLEREAQGHGDAYTIAIEEREPDGTLIAHESFMLLEKSLMKPEKFGWLLASLEHEIRHFKHRGQGLQRREEEQKVFTASVRRLKEIADLLEQQGDKASQALAKTLREEVIPDHERRGLSWNR